MLPTHRHHSLHRVVIMYRMKNPSTCICGQESGEEAPRTILRQFSVTTNRARRPKAEHLECCWLMVQYFNIVMKTFVERVVDWTGVMPKGNDRAISAQIWWDGEDGYQAFETFEFIYELSLFVNLHLYIVIFSFPKIISTRLNNTILNSVGHVHWNYQLECVFAGHWST